MALCITFRGKVKSLVPISIIMTKHSIFFIFLQGRALFYAVVEQLLDTFGKEFAVFTDPL